VHRPVLDLPADLLWDYLVEMSASCRHASDPLREALSLTKIHTLEYLTTDHGDGRNAVRALGFRRSRRGGVEFFVDKDAPEPPRGRAPQDELEWVADPRTPGW
jgi:hypothetical protein